MLRYGIVRVGAAAVSGPHKYTHTHVTPRPSTPSTHLENRLTNPLRRTRLRFPHLQEFNLSLGQSSGASVLPWVAGAVSGNIAGMGADALVKKVEGGGFYSGVNLARIGVFALVLCMLFGEAPLFGCLGRQSCENSCFCSRLVLCSLARVRRLVVGSRLPGQQDKESWITFSGVASTAGV